jgi:hypothetical protein
MPIVDAFPEPPPKLDTVAEQVVPMRVCTHAESDDDTQACAWCGRADGPGHGKEHGGKKA